MQPKAKIEPSGTALNLINKHYGIERDLKKASMNNAASLARKKLAGAVSVARMDGENTVSIHSVKHAG